MRVGQLTTEQIEQRGGQFLTLRQEPYDTGSGATVTVANVKFVSGEIRELVECECDRTTHWHLCEPTSH